MRSRKPRLCESRLSAIGPAVALAILFVVVFHRPVLSQSQRDMVFTQFAAGGGLSCDMFLTNQGDLVVSDVTIDFFDGTGAALTVKSDLGTANSFTFNLALGQTKILRFTGDGPLATGYAIVHTPSNSSVRATEVFRYEQGGSVLFEVGVPQQGLESVITFPVEVKRSGQVTTGIAVAFPALAAAGATEQQLVVNLIKADGTLQQSKVIKMEAGEYFSAYLHEDEFFPGLDNFTGSVCLTGTRGFSGMALRQDKNGVGSVAVSPGPVLGPFLVATTPVNEVEINDTRVQAQLLMKNTLISGTMAAGDEGDFTCFKGQQGDLVSFFATSLGLGGACWPAISLQTADGIELAMNSNSGLMPGLSSFLQAVLPETATYYVRVTNAWGEGAANDFYQLHARVPTNTGPPPPQPSPALTSLGPRKAMRASTFPMVIVGANLLDASKVTITTTNGITAQITGGDDRYVQADVAIPASAPTGVRQVTVTRDGLVSNVLNFEVIAASAQFFVNGNWTGTTSEGEEISFTISGGNLTEIRFGAYLVGGGCAGVTTQIDSGMQIPISKNVLSFDGPFQGKVFGAFDSAKTASGWLRIGSFEDCAGTGIATWTATRP